MNIIESAIMQNGTRYEARRWWQSGDGLSWPLEWTLGRTEEYRNEISVNSARSATHTKLIFCGGVSHNSAHSGSVGKCLWVDLITYLRTDGRRKSIIGRLAGARDRCAVTRLPGLRASDLGGRDFSSHRRNNFLVRICNGF
jgi:hypothetical protein